MTTAAILPRTGASVQKTCPDCGENYSIAVHHAKHSKRCAPCQETYRVQYHRARDRHREYSRAAYEIKIGGPWVIARDPDNSWTPRASLNWSDIHRLAAVGSLTEGTVFRNENDGRRLIVTVTKGKLVAREMK